MASSPNSKNGIELLAAVEFVEDLCARDTLAARTRMLLLKLEKQGHKLGWDHPDVPGIFQVYYNPRTGHVEYHWSDATSSSVAYVSKRNGGAVGEALVTVAAAYERMAAGEMDHHLPPELRGEFTRKEAGSDLWGNGRPGWKFYGYGIRCESWMVSAGDDDIEVDEYTAQHRPDEHPNRFETRDVWFAARDGLVWWVSRRRGSSPVVHAQHPESDITMTGGIANGLTRMTNVVAGNPVPVIPAERPSRTH